MSVDDIEGFASEVATELIEFRRRQPLPKPKDVRGITTAVCRYHATLKSLQKCIDQDFVPAEIIEGFSFDDHKTTLGEIREGVSKEGASFKRTTVVMNEAFESVAHKIVDQSEWLQERKNDVTIVDPEGRVFWLGSFGQTEEVEWKDFWHAFTQYMGPVYGFPTKLNEEGVPGFEYMFMENGVKCCMALNPKKADVVSMKDFREFCERYGPWPELYKKSLTLCDLSGEPLDWFLPTTSGQAAANFFRSPKHKANAFLVRYSSKSGCLVRQSRQVKTLIQNSDTGYAVKGHPKTHEDIPSALRTVWKKQIESVKDEWEQALDALDVESDEAGYSTMPGNDNKRGPTTLEDIHADVLETKAAVESMHKDLIQFGLRLTTALKSTLPRLFFIIPEMTPDGETLYDRCKKKMKDTFKTHWRVFLLCEGNHFIEKEGKQMFGCHITKHEGYEVSLPKDGLVKALPFIRVGLKVASVACAVAAGGVGGDLGGIADLLDSMAGADKFALLAEQLGDMEEFLTDKKSSLPEDQSKVMNDYKTLRTLLADWLQGENLEEGRCADLELMWHKGEGKKVWVCGDHHDGLIGLDDSAEVKESNVNDLQGPVSEEVKHDSTLAEPQPSESTVSLMSRTATLLNLQDATMTVYVKKAHKLKNVDTGLLGNKSDPYCFICPVDITGVALPRKETKYISDDLDPEWNEMFEWNPKRAIDYIEFEVWDWNKYTKHVLLGRCEIKIVDSGVNSFELEDELQLLPKPGFKNNAKGSLDVKVKYSFQPGV